MSSILRALKKLEEDSMPGDGQKDDQKIKMKQMVNRRTKAPRATNRFLSIILALLLVAVAVLIVMNLNRGPSISESQDTSPQKSLLTHNPQQPPPLKEEPKNEAPREPPEKSIPAAITVEQSRPSTIQAFPETGQPPRSAKVEKKQRPEFVLNGVLWSDKPEKRVALINDRYLKEGDSINGVLIIRITKKTITLQDGKEKWTISVKK